jgi:hypothetical protein
MYSFLCAFIAFWHGICNMMYRHPCILHCMHFVSYALDRKSFCYIHCSPWDAIYVFVSLFGMLWLVWLMVDGYVFGKISHICSLMCKCLYMILTCFSGLAVLNLWLDS